MTQNAAVSPLPFLPRVSHTSCLIVSHAQRAEVGRNPEVKKWRKREPRPDTQEDARTG